MRPCLALLLAFPFLTSAGCSLYSGDDDVCAYPAEDESGASRPGVGLRNPETGECEYFGTDDQPCDPECGPCPAYSEPVPEPSWGLCESQCTGLGEGTCLETSGCRGIYTEGPEDLLYLACWATDTSGPIQGGACEGLGAYECSRHDDCAAVHQTNCDFATDSDAPGCEPTEFQRCAEERTYCASDAECGDGLRCNAAEVCLPAPGCEEDGGCEPVCYGYCVPDDQPDPGSCYGDVECRALPPECPDDTTPGIDSGCWTGYCIPLDQCESQPACGQITEEPSCVARPDCSALYEGIDCTCDESGCACAEWVFDRCE